MKTRIYNFLVNHIPGIREKYKEQREKVHGIGRIGVWFYLLYLNISYYVFHNHKLGQIEKYPYYEKKMLYDEGSESSLAKRKKPAELIEILSQYDVISFDVFDTLVLRKVSEPSDIFFFVGNELKYMDFQRIRIDMELKARQKKFETKKNHEIKLEDIYNAIAEETGIDKEVGMETEFNTEKIYCFANPYMKSVIEGLMKIGKRVIITSDMYLNTEQIKELLASCGFPELAAYYVSCDYELSKSKGDMYEFVKAKEGEQHKFIHVGDNYIADVEQAKKHGFATELYVNVNWMGTPYRPEDMSVITGALYRGLVNTHIHNGIAQYSREYEYGYIYGGLFVAGYCQFIHDYVQRNNIEKILFLARDGDILSKAYAILHPDEVNKSEYVYWSRLAATKMTASYYKHDYLRRFLYRKVNQNYTFEQIFNTMELTDMLPKLEDATEITATDKLTDGNVEKVKKYLLQSWNEVLGHYDEQLQAGKQYFEKKLSNCKKAIAVDIGWAGSGALTLNYIVKNIWDFKCDIVGIIAGTNSCHNAEVNTSETFLQNGELVSYMYSQRENRDIWKLHNPASEHNLYWELLLDAPMGSFQGFYLDKDGKVECRLKKCPEGVKKIEDIQNGILDFVDQYNEILGCTTMFSNVSGRDAYAPMVAVGEKMNRKFIDNIKDIMDNTNVE